MGSISILAYLSSLAFTVPYTITEVGFHRVVRRGSSGSMAAVFVQLLRIAEENGERKEALKWPLQTQTRGRYNNKKWTQTIRQKTDKVSLTSTESY